MKSKTFCFNKTIFKKNISHYWPIWVMILIWNLFILPFTIYSVSLRYEYARGLAQDEIAQERIDDIFEILQIYINPVILFLFAVVAVMAVFSYLYQSRSANAIHALPVTRMELFFTNYICGLFFLIIPQTIGFLAGILVSAMCGYTSMNHMLTGWLFAIGISFLFYNFTVFIAMLTGQLLAVSIFAVISNFLYVGCKLIVRMLMYSVSYGVPLSYASGKADVLSPLYYLTSLVKIAYEETDQRYVSTGIIGGKAVVVYALISIAFVIVAALIYRMKDIETAGTLISISWICPIFRWGVAFCGGSLFGVIFSDILNARSGLAQFLSVFLFGVVFGVVCFFGAQMCLEKGFRVFQKKRMIEAGVFLVCFTCLYAAVEWDVFGLEKKIPNVEQVKEAHLDERYRIVGLREEEVLTQLIEIHAQAIQSKKEFERHVKDGGETSHISIRYKMQNGTSLNRYYEIPIDEESLQNPSSVIQKIAALSSEPELYARYLFGVYNEEIRPSYGALTLYEENGEFTTHEFTEEEVKEIYLALRKDIEEGNFKQCVRNACLGIEDENTTYDNSLTIDFVNMQSQQTDVNAASRWQIENEAMGSANIRFDKNCKHLIQALLNTNAIKSEEDLTTIRERNQLEEAQEEEGRES